MKYCGNQAICASTKSLQEFEFVSYQNKRDVLFLADGKLKIKLKPLESEGDVRGVLDLREGLVD